MKNMLYMNSHLNLNSVYVKGIQLVYNILGIIKGLFEFKSNYSSYILLLFHPVMYFVRQKSSKKNSFA